MTDILGQNESGRATEGVNGGRKSFTDAHENLVMGSEVFIMKENLKPERRINSILTKVVSIKDTLFEAGDFKFYKKIERILVDGSTEHKCYGKDNKGITAVIKG